MMSTQVDSAQLEHKSRMDSQTIMLVDDDPIFRRFTSVVLEKEGFFVIEAEHGLDGLQKLREEVPDLIICDISMPILNGIEFAEEVSWEYPEVPMIVVSATDDMSDVARALRFGIKDFLTKPISAPKHLLSAISIILEDENKHSNASRDFSSQWFRVGEQGDVPDDKELYWHLDYLKDNPSAAKDLLNALLPDRDTKQGKWKCSYSLLQSLENMPLVFDYAWLIDGQFAFYVVDSTTEAGDGVATSLLIRALFNDTLRRQNLSKAMLADFAENLERGLECINGVSPVSALIGIADMTDGTVSILPAGLEAIWTQGAKKVHIEAGHRLGMGCLKNTIIEDLSILCGGKLNIANIGVSHFSLDIKPDLK
ncbi:response regulator [Vibrio algarum]